MKTTKILFILILLSFISCKGEEDSYFYPPVILEFATVQTNATGQISSLKTDKGIIYPVDNYLAKNKLSANASLRVVCYYTLVEKTAEKKVDIYAVGTPTSTKPEKIKEQERKIDPVSVQSIWLAGDYINLILSIKAQNKSHSLKFMEDSITNDNGISTIHLSLFHNKNGDIEAYSQRAYLSVPLESYIKQFPNGFNISFSINSYDGLQKFPFTYQSAAE